MFFNHLISKKSLITFLIILITIGIIVSVYFLFLSQIPIENNKNVVPYTNKINQQPITKIISNQSSQKNVKDCIITPYNKEQSYPYYIDVRGGAICHFNIHKSLPTYNFYLRGDVESNTIDQIEITKGIGNETFVQKLEARMGESPIGNFFEIQDINSDGYNDIRLTNTWGATGNTFYNYWLFDPSKNIFVENTDLSSLSNPTPQLQTKTITTYKTGGMAGCIYTKGTYKFDSDGNLVPIRLEKQDLIEGNKNFTKVISELKGDVMITSTTTGNCGI